MTSALPALPPAPEAPPDPLAVPPSAAPASGAPPFVPAVAAPPEALLLYARAGLQRRQPLADLREALARAFPDLPLAVAFEDQFTPAVPDLLDALYARGIRRLRILPCGLPHDSGLAAWLPGALRAHLAERPDFEIALCPPLEDFLDLAAAARQAVTAPPLAQVQAAQPAMGKPGWTGVPAHRHQILFCLGARCAHRGGHRLLAELRQALRGHRGLVTGAERVLCQRTSCLFPCNQGPLMVVHPEGIWYGGLTPELLRRIVEEHLLAGRPVREAVLHPPGLAAP